MAALKNVRTVISEFLDTSSIAGIVHIANAKSTWTKCAWVIVISVWFVIAGYLTNNSFVSWRQSPFITTSETLPIADAVFPVVTVCPPKGTNTSLNYDIVAAQNVTLDNKTRIEIFDKAKTCIYETMLLDHFNDNLFWADEEDNVKAMLLGNMEINDDLIKGRFDHVSDPGSRISCPKGRVIKVTGTKGSIRTPKYNAMFDKERYCRNIEFKYEIYMPKQIPQGVIAILELSYDTPCLLYTSPSPRDATLSRMPSSA